MRGFYFKMLRINIKNISYYILIILASLIFSIKNRQYLINFALLIIVWVESNNKLFKLSISFGSSRKKYYINKIIYCFIASFIITLLLAGTIIKFKINISGFTIIDKISYIILLYILIYALTSAGMFIEIYSLSEYPILAGVLRAVLIFYGIYKEEGIIKFAVISDMFIGLLILIVFNLLGSYFILKKVEI